MKKHHDCKEVVQQFQLLLDGELHPKQEQEIMCELQRCIHCLEEYNLEKQFKDFLQKKLERKTPTATFMAKLKTCCKEKQG
ncbi:MAG: hypothetical protein R2777_03630 [Chitinophagales bacterium]|nr:hypothetical protein [Bacteroidota bacterium]MCB9226116.1 hypothetical protein [Chitinophagales bacterium]